MVEESFEELIAVSSFFITYMVGGWVRESEVCFWSSDRQNVPATRWVGVR